MRGRAISVVSTILLFFSYVEERGRKEKETEGRRKRREGRREEERGKEKEASSLWPLVLLISGGGREGGNSHVFALSLSMESMLSHVVSCLLISQLSHHQRRKKSMVTSYEEGRWEGKEAVSLLPHLLREGKLSMPATAYHVYIIVSWRKGKEKLILHLISLLMCMYTCEWNLAWKTIKSSIIIINLTYAHNNIWHS